MPVPVVLVSIVTFVIYTSSIADEHVNSWVTVSSLVVLLALLLPTLSVIARRLRDSGRRPVGVWVLVICLVIVTIVILNDEDFRTMALFGLLLSTYYWIMLFAAVARGALAQGRDPSGERSGGFSDYSGGDGDGA